VEATKRQRWALFCLTRLDWRQVDLSKEEASEIIRLFKQGKRREALQFVRKFFPEAEAELPLSERELREALKKARKACEKASKERLRELERQGPKYAVVENDPSDALFYDPSRAPRVVGLLPDNCGRAWLWLGTGRKPEFKRNRQFVNCFKRAGRRSESDPATYSLEGFELVKHYRGGWLLHPPLGGSQFVSVQEAGAEAVKEVLKRELKVEAFVQSRLD